MKEIVWNAKLFEELSTQELYKIMKTRQEVFIIEQACNYLDADDYDEKAIHLWAEKKGQILAYCRIFEAGIKYPETSIGRVLTHPKFRNMKLGRFLMRISLDIIETRFRTNSVRISAQDYLIKFYNSFGFEEVGKKYMEDQLPHSEMLRKQ